MGSPPSSGMDRVALEPFAGKTLIPRRGPRGAAQVASTLVAFPNVDVYEDPQFSETSRTQSVYTYPRDVLIRGGEELERLLPPKEMARQVREPAGLRYSCSIDHDVQPQVGGRWWPVWLVGRTKTGWWTICWYQILDGTWRIVFWWYADVHVHLLDVLY